MLFALLGAFGAQEVLLLVIMSLPIVWCFWRVFSKAGFPGELSLLMLVPFLNLFMLFFLAFARWPALPGATAERGRKT